MMGEPVGRQDRLFYEFDLEDMVPADHLLRRIDAALDLSWLRGAMKPHYSHLGCPSVCPELMVRILPPPADTSADPSGLKPVLVTTNPSTSVFNSPAPAPKPINILLSRLPSSMETNSPRMMTVLPGCGGGTGRAEATVLT